MNTLELRLKKFVEWTALNLSAAPPGSRMVRENFSAIVATGAVPGVGRWILLIMSDRSAETPSKFATWFFILTGSYSLAVPLIITPIALVRLSAANHGHPIFGWALCFYLSGLITGAISLIVVWKIRRFARLWLPLVGVSCSGALAFLAFFFWAMSGMNIQ